jgi:hypothetical protein
MLCGLSCLCMQDGWMSKEHIDIVGNTMRVCWGAFQIVAWGRADYHSDIPICFVTSVTCMKPDSVVALTTAAFSN